MVIYYARWLRNTETEVQLAQVIVTEKDERGVKEYTVITITNRGTLSKTEPTVEGAMDKVADIAKRLGKQQFAQPL